MSCILVHTVKIMLFGRFPGTAFGNEGLDTRKGESLIDAGHIHYVTFRALKLLAKEAGFKQELKVGIGGCNTKKLHD